jgi:hypothetical protein
MHTFKSLDNKKFAYDVILAGGNLATASLESFSHEGTTWNSETQHGIALWANLFYEQKTIYASSETIYLAKRADQKGAKQESKFFLISSESLGKGKFGFTVVGASSSPQDLFEEFGKKVDERWKLVNNPYSFAELMRDRIEELDKMALGAGSKVVELEINAEVASGYVIVAVDREGFDKTSVKTKEDVAAVIKAVDDETKMLNLRG